MESKPDDLRGMSPAAAKEYIFHHITALKLTEKSRLELLAELDKWEKRAELARNKGDPNLTAAAEKEAALFRAKTETLADEIAELKALIEKMRKEIPLLAARERSVDPDLLEQELLIALGKNPGDDLATEKAERDFKALEADAALEALKVKLGMPGNAATVPAQEIPNKLPQRC